MGHQVTECNNVEEAYATYITGDFSMVLIDIKLTALLEQDLLHRITALPGEKANVVLFANYDDKGAFISRGADQYTG